jgi:hypothetical protein
MIDLKTRAVAPFFPDARTFHNIYKLQILFMLVVVIINQNVFTVTHVFFTVTNIPFRHEFKNDFCILY